MNKILGYLQGIINFINEASIKLNLIENKTFTGTLGNRMKFYESLTRFFLPKKIRYVIRVDGKNFSNHTKQFERPFDDKFIEMMNQTALHLCENIMGAEKAFVQSDEISIVVSDMNREETQPWFGGKLDKILSVSSALATKEYNRLNLIRQLNIARKEFNISFKKMCLPSNWIEFDSRVILLPNDIEIENCLLWRQQDCKRNSIQSVAQTHFSPTELDKKNTKQLLQMVKEKVGHQGKTWENYTDGEKYGRWIVKEEISNDEYGIKNKWVIKNNVK